MTLWGVLGLVGLTRLVGCKPTAQQDPGVTNVDKYR